MDWSVRLGIGHTRQSFLSSAMYLQENLAVQYRVVLGCKAQRRHLCVGDLRVWAIYESG
jgi:hypothetical protein